MKYYAVGKGDHILIVQGHKRPAVTMECVDTPGREINPATNRWRNVTVRLARLTIKGGREVVTIRKYQSALYCGKEGTPEFSGDVKEVPKERYHYVKALLPPRKRRN